MEESAKYPLEQLAMIKQKRLEEAEKLLAEKKGALAKEQQKLADLEQKRDEVKNHYQAKLDQLREKLDTGTSTDKITQMKQYLKIVTEDLKVEEQKVQAQIKVVSAAAAQVELARQDLFKKQKDVEKLKIHHKEWKHEENRAFERKEADVTDEMGGAMHIIKKTKRKK